MLGIRQTTMYSGVAVILLTLLMGPHCGRYGYHGAAATQQHKLPSELQACNMLTKIISPSLPFR